jgi:hypothetical protein
VSCEDGICVPEGKEKWMYGNCVQFLILVCVLKHGVRINNYGGKLFIRSRLFIGLK